MRFVREKEVEMANENMEVGKARAAEPLLEVQHITKDFPGVRALDDVSLQFMPGRREWCWQVHTYEDHGWGVHTRFRRNLS